MNPTTGRERFVPRDRGAGVTETDADGTAERRSLPLADLTVVELGTIVAGPFAGSLLADLGADVVKVERPDGGDVVRSAGGPGEAIFAALNRNKRSVALDLKTDAGREALGELVAAADVFVENLGRGTPERLGIGYDDLAPRNEGLIYLSVKGFREGPYGDRAGMDVVAEAMSGLMAVTGEPGGSPVRVGTSIADVGAALYGVLGVMVALRERERTGRGQRVDGTLFEACAHWMGYWLTHADLTGEDPEPLGASHPSWGLYDAFETATGPVFVGVTTERHWPALCRAIGAEELLADERFETAADRRERSESLTAAVAERLAGRDREPLLEALHDERVPAAPINAPSDLLDDPGLAAAGLLTEVDAAPGADQPRPARSTLAPVSGDRIATGSYRDPPAVGEHTAAVLRERGLSADAVADLAARGAFGDRDPDD
jgi:crotonobetainyl-CoA:carnitine CoA-transferase CaiB-like acyl-CoA transferase